MLAFEYVVICVLVISAVLCDDTQNTDVGRTTDSNDASGNDGSVDISTTTLANLPDFKKLTKKRCARHYNMNCLKVDLISSIDKLSKNTDFNVLPGVKVIANPDAFASQKNADLKMVFSADNVGDQLDELLLKRLTSYAKSLSLNVQILDKDQKKGKSFGTGMLENFIRSYYTVDGRADKKTGKWGSTLITAAVLTGGTLLWMGLSSLMAMATKALAAALLSIVISCFTAYKTSGNAHHKSTTTYEIVAKPVYSHAYTAELQHDPHAAAAGHQYGRNMEWDKMASISSRSEVLPIRDDVHQLAYKAHVRPIYKRSLAL